MILDVYEAVPSRRAVRGFTSRQVSREVPERVLSAAAWAPSGSNLQPWRICADRPAAGRAQEARRRTRGRRAPLGRAGVRDVPGHTEVPLPRAPIRLRP
ncbi:nitroreductase family protein [Streptomyces glomeratus]|uniref:nitroreductase family protein n=1 Tax=Streptomyces glomeratus TaxID=284452 RepID=UPI003556D9AF